MNMVADISLDFVAILAISPNIVKHFASCSF